MKSKIAVPIRQGDVMLIPVEKLPEGKVVNHATLTVALGEATGHDHTLYPRRDSNLESPSTNVIQEILSDGKRFIKLDVEWLLRHQEHDTIKIAPGVYEVGVREQEYDPFEKIMKRVVD